MTTDATLAALTEALDRDEAIAQAAAEADTAETGDGSWVAAEADYHGIGLFRSESEGSGIDYYPTVDTEHISRHHPARVLRQVEVFQRVLKLHAEAERDSALSDRDAGFEAGVYAALELLASIYTEPTDTEREGTP